MPSELPAELWIQIFRYALEEYDIFSLDLPTALTPSWWWKGVGNKWTLRTPLDSVTIAHRHRNALLKVRLLTDCSERHDSRGGLRP